MGQERQTVSKKDEKILEQGYSIEALEDEVEELEEVIASKQARIVELIHENDRLTLAYEPYRPPGDENEDLGYYDLIDENNSLAQNVLDKIEVINELDQEIRQLQSTVRAFQSKINLLDQMLQVETNKNRRRKYAGCLSFDFWPISDWFRFKLYRWNPAKAFQLTIGPIRLDLFEA